MRRATAGIDTVSRPGHRLPALVIVSLCVCNGAAAQEAPTSAFSLSGFGTLGVVHSSEDRADFGVTAFKPDGAGYTQDFSPEVDSRVGVQLTINAAADLTATLQVIAEQRQNGRYMPHVEWANIKYQITPQLSVRVGRTALANFLVSDFRKVGYANPWVRPPEEVYSLIPISSGDGVDASYTLNAGAVTHTLLAGFGKSDSKSTDGEVARGRNEWTFSDTLEYGPLTLRVAYQTGKVRIATLAALMAGFRQFGAQGNALADRYDPNDRKITFLALGGTYDPGQWFVTTEWGRSNLRSAFGERTVWYATSGYRIMSLTPYLTYATTKANSNTSDPGLTLSSLPPEQAAQAAGLNAALNSVLASLPVQQTVSAGARWDFMANVALKLQYDHMNMGVGSAGVLGNVQPGFQKGGTVHLFSASMDFVW